MEHSDKRDMWARSFSETDKEFFKGIEEIVKLNITPTELIHHFPIYTGHVNLARYLALYEVFRKVEGISGHYADVGTWTGASFLFVAKLIKIFEPYLPSQIHAFDWFQGIDPAKGDEDKNYAGNYETLVKMIKIQGLSDVAVVHKIDLVNELAEFGNDPIYAPLYYKYVFMDCGYKEVLEKAVPFFWDRLLSNGIMLFDHITSDVKDETEIVRSVLPAGTAIRNFPFARQPMGYAIKNGL